MHRHGLARRPVGRTAAGVTCGGQGASRVDSLRTRPYVALVMPGAVAPQVTARLDLLDPVEVARLGGLEVVTEGIVEGFLAGLHRSPRRGFFVEFAEHRMYQPGDELRYLDWRLLARSDRLYVKQFEEETNLRAMLLLDTSRSMDWCGAPDIRLTKAGYAARLVAALALVLLRQRDATGLLTFDDAVRMLIPPQARWPPRRGAGPRHARRAGAPPGGGAASTPRARRVHLRSSLRSAACAPRPPLPAPPRPPGAGPPRDGSRRGRAARSGRGPLRGPRVGPGGGASPRGLGRGLCAHGASGGGGMARGVPAPRHRLRAGHDGYALRPGAAPGAGALDRPRVIGFAAPWALLGLAAAAIPLLLHLFARRVPPTVIFPATRYLAETARAHHRRLTLQHWLLLLVRTLIVTARYRVAGKI